MEIKWSFSEPGVDSESSVFYDVSQEILTDWIWLNRKNHFILAEHIKKASLEVVKILYYVQRNFSSCLASKIKY